MKKSDGLGGKIWLEVKDMLAGAAFPLMLMLILSVTFIGMSTSFSDDLILSVVMLSIGEVLLAAAYVIFGRQSGVTSVRKLVQHAKKRQMGTTDRQSLNHTGEYSPYKGFLIGFISCIPYIIFQAIECIYHNSFCYFVLQYVFGWAAIPFALAKLNQGFNFLLVLFPTAVHGIAYIIGAHIEWNKQQRVAAADPAKKG